MGRKSIAMILILAFLNFLVSPDIVLAIRDDYDKYDFSSLDHDSSSNSSLQYVWYGALALGVIMVIVLLVKGKSSSAQNQEKETNQYASIHSDDKNQFNNRPVGKIVMFEW